MEKDENMRLNYLIKLLIIGFLASSCNNTDLSDNNGPESEITKETGKIVFEFNIPERRVPVEKINRINLSVAVDAKSLFSGYFLASANVSDLVNSYAFTLKEGDYYYQAGITCSSAGDTCLWDGFPGGQWGEKWAMGTISVIREETIVKKLTFNK